ncbi:MAG: hypothetical protein M0Z66_00555 [Thermaerobacter sp.]|nr:hypothetical protein [Thermaerobacter sp.]
MVRTRLILRLAGLTLLATLLGACDMVDADQGFIKGISYAGYTPNVYATSTSDRLVAQLATTGANWLVVIPQWYQDDLQSTQIGPRANQSPSDASVRHLIQFAHGLGLKVMLKPFDDPENGAWRARIHPGDWPAWFRSYTKFIEHYADLAQAEHCEALTVGVEYSSSDASHTAQWREVIRKVRSRFSGLLTYAADWPQYRKIGFWQDLDAIGIDAYFPLSGQRQPSLTALRLGWIPWMRQITRYLRAYPKKRVIFTEIGYASRQGAAADPSQYAKAAPPDPGLQARLYQSVFDTVYHEPWLIGLCWFWWDNPSVPDYPAGPRDVGFTPRGKPAEAILRENFRADRKVFTHAL